VFRGWAHVRSTGTNERPQGALFKSVCNPTHRPTQCKNVERSPCGQLEVSSQGDQREIERGTLSREPFNGLRERSPAPSPVREAFKNGGCTNIAVGVEGMPEARQVIAAFQSGSQGRLQIFGVAYLSPQSLDARRHPSVARPR
jgi:hypothetical protein